MRVGGSSIHAQRRAAVATTAIQQAACARCAATATALQWPGVRIARCVPSPGLLLECSVSVVSCAGWRSPQTLCPFRTEHSCRHSKRSGHSTSNLAPIGRTRSSSGSVVTTGLQQRLLAVLMGVPVHAARHHDGQRRRVRQRRQGLPRIMRTLRWNLQERSVQQRVLQSGLRRTNQGAPKMAPPQQHRRLQRSRWQAKAASLERWRPGFSVADPDLLHVYASS